MKKRKSILLCMPNDYGISNHIIDNLTLEGYDVYKCLISDKKYKYKNISHRINNCFRKIFFRDFNYKRSLKMQERYIEVSQNIKNVPDVNFALFIRPDLFPVEFIKELKNKTDKIIGYQWDGLNRFPNIKEYIDLFDRFFVFDHNDVHSHEKTLPITNFYFSPLSKNVMPQNTIYFLATFDNHRFELMNKLKVALDKTECFQDINFITNNDRQLKKLKDNNYKIQSKIDYNQNLFNVQQSTILIDLVTPIHAGLSFRVFEALCYDKKLITNNSSVKLYDFYNQNNIFIWDESKSENDILTFLNLPIQPIKVEIKYKYSFHNWINYILEDEEHVPIKLPNKGIN